MIDNHTFDVITNHWKDVLIPLVIIGWILREIHLRHWIKKIAGRIEPTPLEKAKAAAKTHKRKKRLEGRVSKKQKRLEKKLGKLTTSTA